MSHSGPLSGVAPRPSASRTGRPVSFHASHRPFRAVRGHCGRIIGVPDHDEYLAHMQRHFPDCTPMDPRTFERDRMAAKYASPAALLTTSAGRSTN
jgi:uncharacterized short protein YbdD (DUF466 family)